MFSSHYSGVSHKTELWHIDQNFFMTIIMPGVYSHWGHLLRLSASCEWDEVCTNVTFTFLCKSYDIKLTSATIFFCIAFCTYSTTALTEYTYHSTFPLLMFTFVTALCCRFFFRLIHHRLNRNIKNRFFSIFGNIDHVSLIRRWSKNQFFLRIFFINYTKIEIYFCKNRRLFSQK